MKFIAIIPARYASTRFPAKPLAILGDKMVIERVYEQVSKVLETVVVATDDKRIYDAVKSFGGEVVMTSTKHQSGTDRCYEAYKNWGEKFDVVINVQGDEPFIDPSQLRAIMGCFESDQTQIATLVKPFSIDEGIDALESVNTPKVVIDKDFHALYFSRSVIPHLRGVDKNLWLSKQTFYKHIGMYAFRSDILRQVTELPQSQLEIAESLEQLRWLENGYKIGVGISNIETIGIDTPEDLERAKEFFIKRR